MGLQVNPAGTDNKSIKESVEIQKEQLAELIKNSKAYNKNKWVPICILVVSILSLLSIWFLNYK